MPEDAPVQVPLWAGVDLGSAVTAYTVTTSSVRAGHWHPAAWETAAALESWREIQARASVRQSCAEALKRLEGLPAARAGRPVTAVALVLGLRK